MLPRAHHGTLAQVVPGQSTPAPYDSSAADPPSSQAVRPVLRVATVYAAIATPGINAAQDSCAAMLAAAATTDNPSTVRGQRRRSASSVNAPPAATKSHP